MSIYQGSRIIRTLRTQLLPVDQATLFSDELEESHLSARRAAVLLPLYEQDGELFLAFIRRASTLRAHGGQIAFPGGAVDPQDTSLLMTALREANEEIGLTTEPANVLGMLLPVFTVVSNFLITPVVAFFAHGLGELHLQESEVTEVIHIPLQALADPAIFHTEEWTQGGRTRTVYFYDYGSLRIWGATGRILNSLLSMLPPAERWHDTPTQ